MILIYNFRYTYPISIKATLGGSYKYILSLRIYRVFSKSILIVKKGDGLKKRFRKIILIYNFRFTYPILIKTTFGGLYKYILLLRIYKVFSNSLLIVKERGGFVKIEVFKKKHSDLLSITKPLAPMRPCGAPGHFMKSPGNT